MKKSAKIIAAIAATAIAGSAAIGGTLAWLTSNADITNTFTMGNVKIALTEQDINNSSSRTSSDQQYSVYPGATITKDPQIEVLAGSEDCYVYAWVKDDLTINGTDAASFTVNGDWNTVKEVNGGTMYRYKEKVTDPATLTKVFNNVKISESVKQAESGENSITGNITVKAFAIQADGLTAGETTADTEAEAYFAGTLSD